MRIAIPSGFVLVLLAVLGACQGDPSPVPGDSGPDAPADQDGDGYAADEDCDDADPTVHPGAEERCDGRDDDCDGLIDEGDAVDAAVFYQDDDDDQFGTDTELRACYRPTGWAPEGGDCDDQDASVFPGAEPGCDDRDHDCDGLVDRDGDCDGYSHDACGGGDCDDGDSSIHPGAEPGCDGDDHDCDGLVDHDADGDGWANETCGGDDCDDGDAATWPGAPEDCDDGVINDCDGTEQEAVEACWKDINLVNADAKLLGVAFYDRAGASVAGPGDVDGDGVNDLLIGAPSADLPMPSTGAAYLVTGPVAGVVSLADARARLIGQVENEAAGQVVAGAGDVNGDGYRDLLIGGRGYAVDPAAPSGAAYLVFGPVSGDVYLDRADVTLLGEASGDHAGYALDSAGDVDGDGLSDLIVGAEYNGGTGAAYLVAGAEVVSGSLGGATAKLLGEQASDHAGAAVAGVGDVDGDGLDDVLVGAIGTGTANTGTAYLLLGPLQGEMSLADADAVLAGEAPSDYAGSALAGAGDVDADGLGDILVAASGHGDGAVYVVLGVPRGSLDLSLAQAVLEGGTGSSFVGTSVAAAGDLQDDGFDDILVGAASTPGSTFVAFGPVSGTVDLAADADAEIGAEYLDALTTTNAGFSVAGPGDIDGDGMADIFIGAPDANTTFFEGMAYLVRLKERY